MKCMTNSISFSEVGGPCIPELVPLSEPKQERLSGVGTSDGCLECSETSGRRCRAVVGSKGEISTSAASVWP